MSRRARCRGLTLPELVMTLLGTAVVLLAVQMSFVSTARAVKGEALRLEALELATAALSAMERELRNAGNDPTGAAGFGIVMAGPGVLRFTADLSQDLNGDGDREDDVGGEQEYPDGSPDDPSEDVTYTFESSSGILWREVAGEAALPLAAALPPDGVSFTYFDADGVELAPVGATPLVADPSQIRRVYITVRARNAVALPGQAEPKVVAVGGDVCPRGAQ